MGVMTRVKRFVSGGTAEEPPEEEDPHADEDPSHVCESCGEEYYTEAGADIPECRACGGVRVEAQ